MKRLSTTVCLGAASLLLAAVTTTTSLAAQKLIADYPLMTDLLDATGNHGPVTLTGNPTPPPAPANGVCVNGIYERNANGQDVRIPDISTLDATDFQLDVDFKLNGFPTSMPGAPVIMGGNLWRWIGIYVQPNGTVGVKYNNSNHSWSTTVLNLNQWYVAVLKFEKGAVELFIDGFRVHTAQVGALTTGPAGQKNFTTNDYSNGRAHNGCIRNLRLWNDTCLTCGMYTRFTTGCGGLTISESGDPKLGGIITLTNGGPNASGSMFSFGAAPANFPLCANGTCVLGTPSLGLLPGPSQVIPIPNNPVFLNTYGYLQGVAISPTGGCFLLILSDTIRVSVGQ